MAARPLTIEFMFCSTIAQLINLLNASVVGADDVLSTEVAGISTDTRTLQPGNVFLALRGENFDGHAFVAAAFQQGAIAAIVDTTAGLDVDSPVPHSPPPTPLLQVPDTLGAYQAIAHWWRTQFDIPVIAVTGSVGKTTTKELIAAVLSALAPNPQSLDPHILKSQANFNNEIGVPRTLLELGDQHRFAVVEMGMRARGEIELLTQIARPTIGVITNVGTAHIERLGSEAAIAQAKCELLAEMPADSVAILNHDNPLLLQTAAGVWHGNTIAFGLEGGNVRGELLNLETLQIDGLKLPLPLPGRHNALNYLAALTVAKALGLDWQPLTEGLQVDLPGGRAKRYELPGDIVVLDETYNAGLESMLASLQLLAETPAVRRIAVLGTMRELGERSPEFHQRVGAKVRQLGLDHLLILADEAEAEALQTGAKGIPARCCTSHAEVVAQLQKLVQPGDRLLFKASRAVGLDRVVEQFCRELSSSLT